MTLNPEQARIAEFARDLAARARGGASLALKAPEGFYSIVGQDTVGNPDLMGLSVARAGKAWNPNWDGINGSRVGRLIEYGPNQVRSGAHGVVKEAAAATNRFSNPFFEGGQEGVVTGGSPTGSLPTGMQMDANGATIEYLGRTVTNGRVEALFKFTGTPTGDPVLWCQLAASAFASTNGQTRTGQMTARLVSGALTNTNGARVRVQELTSAGANVTSGASTAVGLDADQRCLFLARTLSGGGTVARARHGIELDWTSGALSGSPVIAISCPQFETGLIATTPVFPEPNDPQVSTREAETFTYNGFETARLARETYINRDGSLTRFLHNTVAYGSLGFQVTEGATNRLLWSEDLTQSQWVKSSATITPNAARAPDGEMTADRVVTSASATTLIQNVTASISAGARWNASVWLRGEGSNVGKKVGIGIQRVGGGTFEATNIVVTLTNYWQRLSVGHLFANAQTDLRIQIRRNLVSDAAEQATEWLQWGAMLTDKAYTPPYVRTLGATASSLASQVITRRGQWLIQNQPFVVVCDFVLAGSGFGGFPTVWNLGTDSSNRAGLAINEDNGTLGFTTRDGGTVRANITTANGFLSAGGRYRTVCRAQPGAHALWINGVKIGESANASALNLGADQSLFWGAREGLLSPMRHALFSDARFIPQGVPEYPTTDAALLDLSAI